ncbi:PspA/IM30 family protein [Gloeocapsopsis dulcis]|uniref:Phage shock protein A n=1 Tax=Gloeocapsopsis dulcis AAB1 = 1H9 TaxID=1433147 RepID=A0A6N8FVS0_9CHRO|nr:hypothetical protein [Gloeocapsopsis dulcis]MUL37220.1 hypothetical protein [Gloeocapsopsis dulcis AAB1 = 1H9]WNN90169.1 hypothetical protein P0S91_03450 [Gloeocapsopsis dulcis]
MSLYDHTGIELDVNVRLEGLYSSLIQALTDQKIALQKYNQAEIEVNKWQRRVKLAEQKGDQRLAHLALEQKKIATATANKLKIKLDKQTIYVDNLKHKLKVWESRVVANKMHSNSSSAIEAFDRIEEKVLMLEAQAKVVR